jgi:hypothetical protein
MLLHLREPPAAPAVGGVLLGFNTGRAAAKREPDRQGVALNGKPVTKSEAGSQRTPRPLRRSASSRARLQQFVDPQRRS